MIVHSNHGAHSFISFDDEANWRKKWLERRIFLLKQQLSEVTEKLEQGYSQERDEYQVFDLCSRTRPPPRKFDKFISLNPIAKSFQNPLKLLNCTNSPIIPIFKGNEEDKLKQTEEITQNENIENETDHHEDSQNEEKEYSEILNYQPSIISEIKPNHIVIEEPPKPIEKEILPSIPKYIPSQKVQKSEIPTPGWSQCEPIEYPDDFNPSIQQLNDYESQIQIVHMSAEIIQNRILTKQLNLPIDKINSVSLKELKIDLTCADKKLEEKYRKRAIKAQIPPNWEPRPYDQPEDHLQPEEIEIWNELQEKTINHHAIEENILKSDLSFRPKLIRTTKLLLPQINNVTDNSEDSTDESDFQV